MLLCNVCPGIYGVFIRRTNGVFCAKIWINSCARLISVIWVYPCISRIFYCRDYKKSIRFGKINSVEIYCVPFYVSNDYHLISTCVFTLHRRLSILNDSVSKLRVQNIRIVRDEWKRLMITFIIQIKPFGRFVQCDG